MRKAIAMGLVLVGAMAPTGWALTVTDKSGTIVVGGSAQVLMAANANRLGCTFQAVGNHHLWISITGTASAGTGSYDVFPGSVFTCALPTPTGDISVFGFSTGDGFTATEFSR